MGKERIGEKKSFWGLLNEEQSKNIMIPAIQRDYTYGSKTENTDKVLNNMLDNIKKALYHETPDNEEMTMNFVYGYTEEDVNYVPLDGQQRLTTLFLLHYYAALFSNAGDFEKLRRFSYATRETTKSYCQAIIEHHVEIREHYESVKALADTIKDMPWYLPSYDSDPSIRSMQVVFGRIEERFLQYKESLWEKLTREDCPVNFYKLDFGPFGLSDDLYVKMNSRGKKLTEYEIFKSMLLKHIEKELHEKDKKRELAVKFDNVWTDLVWESIGRPSEESSLESIDKAYIRLLRLMLRWLSYKHCSQDTNPKLNASSIVKYFDEMQYVIQVENMLDVFSWVKTNYGSVQNGIDNVLESLKLIVKERNAFSNCLQGKNVTNGDFLLFLGIFYALRQIKEDNNKLNDVRLGLRHLRNLIENSDDEIRDEKMPRLVIEVEEIMAGKLRLKQNVAFNTNQWDEEREKEAHRKEWVELWNYEEHYLLRGSLSAFASNQTLNLSDADELGKLKRRLDNFHYVFDKEYQKNDHLIRAAFLTVKDYSQYMGKYENYRIIGNIPLCWRDMFIKNDRRKNQEAVIEIIERFNPDGVPIKDKLSSIINEYLNDPEVDKTDWRFYAIKYREHTYKAYTHNAGYGYFYVDKNASLNTLETAILQSSGFGYSNVAWYLLPMILKERNENKYNITLATHAAREEEENIYIHTETNVFQLGISQNGWYVMGMPKEDAIGYGIRNIPSSVNSDIPYFYVIPDKNQDYIEWAENHIFKPLESISGFKK